MLLKLLLLFGLRSFSMVCSASFNVFSDFKYDVNPYSSLLNEIVKVNQNRLNILNKNTQLQDFIVSRGRIIPGEEDRYDTLEDDPYISSPKYGLRRFNKRSNALKNLRRNWMAPCTKKAARVCRIACINSAKDLCSVFSCSGSVKRTFRKRCRRNCNAEFKSNKYQYSE